MTISHTQMFQRLSGNQRATLTAVVIFLSLLIAFSIPVGAKTVLTFAPWAGLGQSGIGQFQEHILREYEALNPHIEIEMISLPMNRYDGLLTLFLLPEMPDLVEAHLSLYPELMATGVLSPMPAAMENAARGFFFEPVLQSFEIDGRLYGIPSEYQLYALAYNERVFAESGYASPPATWEDLELMAARGTLRGIEGEIIRHGFVFPDDWPGHGEYATHTFLSFLWSNNGEYIDEDGNVRLSDREALETLEFLNGMFAREHAGHGYIYHLINDWTMMSILPTWVRGEYEYALGSEQFRNIRTSLIPRGKGDHATVQYGWGFFVPDDAPNKEEAWKFLEWYSMQESANGLTRLGTVMQDLGSFPTNPSDLSLIAEIHELPFWDGFLEGMNYARPEPFQPNMLERWKVLGAALEPVLLQERTPLHGLEEAQANMERALLEGVDRP